MLARLPARPGEIVIGIKKLKEFDLALEWIDKGYPYLTKGNSQIQFATLKGQILRDLKRPEEALEVVLGSLSMLTRADWEKDRRNTLLDELTALKEELREIVRLSKQSK